MQKIQLLSSVFLLLLSTTTWSADYTNSIGVDFVKVKAGCFLMGRDANFEDGNNDELPRHKVCITKSFYLGKHEITQGQWVAVMGNNPSHFKGRSKPVEQVSWHDAKTFIKRLNQSEGGNHYRLPTEAEWEYAARAGTSSAWHFGDDEGSAGQYAWYDGNSGERTHPVGQKKPNPWGLYDMYGNVWEWVQDWYGENSYRNHATNDPEGAGSGRYRVRRGGAWSAGAGGLRSAYRSYSSPGNRYSNLGFRLVRQP
jgi:formylglycine-generating enzyme required for sulfatase activity